MEIKHIRIRNYESVWSFNVAELFMFSVSSVSQYRWPDILSKSSFTSSIIKLFFLLLQEEQCLTASLLDISVISTVIYCISPSIILQIPFTVNSCNTLCIMGIFCDVRPHIQRLTVFFKIAVYYCICCNVLFCAILLRLFYFPNFLHLDWHDLLYTVSTTPQQLTDYTLDVLHRL